MEKTSERKRKSKGSLSVIDEFTGTAGSISFAPKVSPDIQERIDAKTQQADAPISVDLVAVGIKTRNEPVINYEQTRNKPVTDTPETRNNPVIETRNENSKKTETRNKPVTQPVTNYEQTRNKPVTVSSFSGATQFQKEILLCIYREMQKSIDRMTPAMSLQHFGQLLGRVDSKEFESLRIVTWRLEKLGLLSRPIVKNGRGGWTRYSLPQTIYAEVREVETRNEPVINYEQTRNKPVTKPVTEAPSSSRDLLIKEESTTTQTQTAILQMDLSLVQHLGITTSVLARCVELYPNLQPEQLEGLVFRFAEFAKDPKNKVQNARGFFISLAEQASKGQIPLDHIETPDDRLMRLFVERQKEAKSRHAEVERAAQEFECEAWLETLTIEMKLSLIPESSILKVGTAAHSAMLKRHFVENIWPARRVEILETEATL